MDVVVGRLTRLRLWLLQKLERRDCFTVHFRRTSQRTVIAMIAKDGRSAVLPVCPDCGKCSALVKTGIVSLIPLCRCAEKETHG